MLVVHKLPPDDQKQEELPELDDEDLPLPPLADKKQPPDDKHSSDDVQRPLEEAWSLIDRGRQVFKALFKEARNMPEYRRVLATRERCMQFERGLLTKAKAINSRARHPPPAATPPIFACATGPGTTRPRHAHLAPVGRAARRAPDARRHGDAGHLRLRDTAPEVGEGEAVTVLVAGAVTLASRPVSCAGAAGRALPGGWIPLRSCGAFLGRRSGNREAVAQFPRVRTCGREEALPRFDSWIVPHCPRVPYFRTPILWSELSTSLSTMKAPTGKGPPGRPPMYRNGRKGRFQLSTELSTGRLHQAKGPV